MADLKGQYIYLVSTLPYLQLETAPPLTSDEFLAACTGILGEAEYAALANVSLLPHENPACEGERFWHAVETYIRNYLIHTRARGNQQEIHHWMREYLDAFPLLDRQLEEALGAENPAHREWKLDQCRWEKITHLELGREYSFDALVFFRLKLMLVEKWQNRSKEKGKENLDNLLNTLWEEAEQHRVTTEAEA